MCGKLETESGMKQSLRDMGYCCTLTSFYYRNFLKIFLFRDCIILFFNSSCSQKLISDIK